MSTNTGGSAYPSTQAQWERGMEGMTLRDWFAGQALAGMLANFMRTDNLSNRAYRLADEMIVAREERAWMTASRPRWTVINETHD